MNIFARAERSFTSLGAPKREVIDGPYVFSNLPAKIPQCRTALVFVVA